MAGIINQNFYRNSYMLEFKSGAIAEDIFTFSTPPQNEEISLNQRVNETKTYGGAVIDDYGNDTYKISLSGTTGNWEKKLIYCAKKGVKFKTGEEEMFFLKKLIEEYGQYKTLRDKKVYLYKLSGTPIKTLSEMWWRVHVTDFSFKRSKDNPMFWYYTISFIGYKDGIVKNAVLDWLVDKLSKIVNFVKKTEEILNEINIGIAVFNDICTELFAVADKVIDEIENLVELSMNMSIELVTMPNNIIRETKRIGDKVITSSDRIISMSDILMESVNEMNELLCGKSYSGKAKKPDNKNTQNLESRSLEAVVKAIEEGKIKIPENYKNETGMTDDEILDMFKVILDETSTSIQAATALLLQIDDLYSCTIQPGTTNVDDQIVRTYGYKEVTVTNGGTWDSLSQIYYNDASYGALIAVYNAMNGGPTELKVGEKVLIPITRESVMNSNDNEVYNYNGNKDNIGKDIKLTENGDINIKCGDLEITEPRETLNQALNSRLTTELNARVRLTDYGIRSDIGSNVINTYIISSIEQTMLADPRIDTVDEISYQGTGDNLIIKAIYTDINGNHQNYEGVI